MDVLKVYSVRLDCESVEWAEKIAQSSSYWSRSDVMRLAIWISKKVIDPYFFNELVHLWYEEVYGNKSVSLVDVLRTAGIELENLKNFK